MGLEQEAEGDDGDEADYHEYSHRPSGQPSSSSKQKSKSSSSGKGKSKSASSGSSKRRPKTVYPGEGAIEEEEGEEEGPSPFEGAAPENYEGEGDEASYGGAYHGKESSRGGYQSYDRGGSYTGYRDDDDQDPYDREYEDALAASRQDQQQGSRSRGESSRHQESSRQQESARHQESSRYSRRREQSEYSGDYGATSTEYGADYGGGTYDQASEGNLTPRGPGRFDISGNNEEYEALDPRYRVEPSHKFQPGEVFKVLWPEPTGQNVGGTPTISDTQKIKNKYGESFYIGFRRFVVIANDHGHCQCVPILTYGGKGCNKRGVKAEKHGIVYDGRSRARPLPDEPKLGFASVRLTIEVEGESLAKASRVNYSKIVTVEHNVKVFFIGHIAPEDYQIVSDAVNVCWEDKIFQRKKHHRDYDRR